MTLFAASPTGLAAFIVMVFTAAGLGVTLDTDTEGVLATLFELGVTLAIVFELGVTLAKVFELGVTLARVFELGANLATVFDPGVLVMLIDPTVATVVLTGVLIRWPVGVPEACILVMIAVFFGFCLKVNVITLKHKEQRHTTLLC